MLVYLSLFDMGLYLEDETVTVLRGDFRGNEYQGSGLLAV
jgi:hypothetical protein